MSGQLGLLIPLPALSLWLCSQCCVNHGEEQNTIPEPALAGANRSFPVHLPSFCPFALIPTLILIRLPLMFLIFLLRPELGRWREHNFANEGRETPAIQAGSPPCPPP